MREGNLENLFAAAVADYIRGGTNDKEPGRSTSAFLVETDGSEQIILTARGAEGQRTRLSTGTPAEELLRAVELDYTQLRDEVTRLWEAYPLDGTDRPEKKKELARLSEEVREASVLLRETDPPGYFYVTQRLAYEHPSLDAALASDDADLMEMGARLLNILETPALAQVRLRNLFEVAFDGTERATQRERYALLASVYPSVFDGYYPARRIAGADDVPFSASRMEYCVEELDDLYRLLLTLYFSQGKQRIVRCECCFGYFIPKTSRPTIYCDRVFNGRSCKQAGAGWKHLAAMDRDRVLRAYDTLRHKRAAEYNAHMDQHSGVDAKADREYMDAYETWIAAASAAREAYLAREIDAEEFLRRIGYDGEVEASEPKPQGKSDWRRRVERSIDFDPMMEYPNTIVLDLLKDNPEWVVTPASERMQKAQGEHRSLREKYGKE